MFNVRIGDLLNTPATLNFKCDPNGELSLLCNSKYVPLISMRIADVYKIVVLCRIEPTSFAITVNDRLTQRLDGRNSRFSAWLKMRSFEEQVLYQRWARQPRLSRADLALLIKAHLFL